MIGYGRVKIGSSTQMASRKRHESIEEDGAAKCQFGHVDSEVALYVSDIQLQ
jgi:hypothetical protein